MNTQTLLLILLVVAVVFGLGVVVLNRRSGSSAGVKPVVSEPTVADAVVIAETETVATASIEEVVEVPVVELPVVDTPAPPKSRWGKTALSLANVFGGVRARGGITHETWDDLEEALLKADVGIGVTDALLESLRGRVKSKEITSADELLVALQREMASRLEGANRELNFAQLDEGRINVWLFVGVNGVGKTTTIGKVSAQQAQLGRSLVLAAGDTFRAAAAEQLGTWAERSGAELVRGAEGGDPSSVIFDGIQRAAAKGFDLVLGDTAGRLQNKSNLMDELRKVRRIADREPGQVTEVLLVIDATTGQNGLSQAREFTDAAGVTGVVLTKLDGSAKGGIVFAIETEMGIPIKLVGLGETIGDLVAFNPEEYVTALFNG